MMASDSRLRVGLLGLGRMGRNHLRVLSMLRGVELAFIYDTDAAAGAVLAGEKGVSFASDLDKALGEVDAVVICTPTVTHAEYIYRAARKVRHLFVEKPLTDSLDSSLAVERLATERELRIQAGFIERYNPAVVQMRALLRRSDQVVSVDFVRTNKISSRITDVDVITDLMIHDIDLALHLNGPVTYVAAHGVGNGEMIDFASALLTHANGRFSRVQASRITDKKMRSIQATCTDMFIDCELLRKEILISRQSELRQEPGEPYVISSVSEVVEVPPQEALVAELQAFVEGCKDDTLDDAPGVAEAVAAIRICEEIRSSIRTA